MRRRPDPEGGVDAGAVLLPEPGMLRSAAFLGALHAELDAELGAEEAGTSLLQIGLLQGLGDAARALARAEGLTRDGLVLPAAPPLAIQLQANATPLLPGSLEIAGAWPERSEASARLAVLGPAGAPCCHVSAGYTSGWLSGLFEADLLAIETHCAGTGAESCRFVAREAEGWRAAGHVRAAELLAALPFEAFRDLARSAAAEDAPIAAPTPPDPESGAVVHLWGPVMVVPFTGPDEALRAVELMGHDPAARDVSVVVLDLTDTLVDEAFGAAALEQIVETIEAWGADAIFTGVSPLCEAVVADLERPPLMVVKDLSEAVASAFQVADSQRRLL